MKTPKWSKADAKRAAKMGWELDTIANPIICKLGDRFKSNDEAIDWVVDRISWDTRSLNHKTCRTAVRLCLKG